jgi:hypothetical protein
MPLEPMNPMQSRRLAILLAIVAFASIVAAIGIPVWMAHRWYDKNLARRPTSSSAIGAWPRCVPRSAKQLDALRNKDTRRFFLRSGAAALSGREAQQAIARPRRRAPARGSSRSRRRPRRTMGAIDRSR